MRGILTDAQLCKIQANLTLLKYDSPDYDEAESLFTIIEDLIYRLDDLIAELNDERNAKEDFNI